MLAEVLNGDRLTTFSIDFKNLVLSERESIPNSFTGILKVDRTKQYFALIGKEKSYFLKATDIKH